MRVTNDAILKEIFSNASAGSDLRWLELARVKLSGGQHVGHKLAVIQRIQSILVTVYLLELVGATGVTFLGWVACRMLQIDWIPSAPLWFAGYLLVYNLDRLYPDPADPQRERGVVRLCRIVS